MGVHEQLYNIVASFLSDKSQKVVMYSQTSTLVTTKTGAPQGCVLSPLLYTTYTDDLRSEHKNVIFFKYADNTEILELIRKGDETAYWQEVERVKSGVKSTTCYLTPARQMRW